MNNKKAFSLIELSIVILIIGTLIAGIFKASDILDFASKKIVQRLTKESPVVAMPGLVLWYESSLDESFLDAERSDGASISQWNDVKDSVMHGSAINGTQGTEGNRPAFTKDAFGRGVHGLTFDGSDRILFTSIGGSLTNSDFTFFIVEKALAAPDTSGFAPFINIVNSGHDLTYSPYNNAGDLKIRVNFYGSADYDSNSGAWNNNSANINTLMLEDPTLSFGFNGADTGNISSRTITNDATAAHIGYSQTVAAYYSGVIGEVIIFNRALEDVERKEIEEYLGQKYDIEINH